MEKITEIIDFEFLGARLSRQSDVNGTGGTKVVELENAPGVFVNETLGRDGEPGKRFFVLDYEYFYKGQLRNSSKLVWARDGVFGKLPADYNRHLSSGRLNRQGEMVKFTQKEDNLIPYEVGGNMFDYVTLAVFTDEKPEEVLAAYNKQTLNRKNRKDPHENTALIEQREKEMQKQGKIKEQLAAATSEARKAQLQNQLEESNVRLQEIDAKIAAVTA